MSSSTSSTVAGDPSPPDSSSFSSNPLLTSTTFHPLLSPPSPTPDPIPDEVSVSDQSVSPPVDCRPKTIYSRITVGDPQKEQEPAASALVSNSYVTYLVTAVTTGDGEESRVRRRFRDVVALSEKLTERYRGFFVPPRPDKSIVESQVMQKQEFVEQRRVALEKYLRRLAAHPVLGRSDELCMFLHVQGKFPLQTSTNMASSLVLDGDTRLPGTPFGEAGAESIAPKDVQLQPAKGGSDWFRMFRDLKQKVVNDWVGLKPAVVEEDKEFIEKKEKIQDLEQQISITSQQAEALVKAQQYIGDTMGELGLAFIKLSKFESKEAEYDSQRKGAADARCLGTAAVRASRSYRELNAQTIKNLDTLHDHLELMLSVREAFSDRSSALGTVQTLVSELSSLHAKAEKLETPSSRLLGADTSKIQKMEELKETIRVTENEKDVASREYERIKENNKSELERLKKERHEDFFSLLKGFVINQVGFAENSRSVWEKLMDETSVYIKASD